MEILSQQQRLHAFLQEWSEIHDASRESIIGLCNVLDIVKDIPVLRVKQIEGLRTRRSGLVKESVPFGVVAVGLLLADYQEAEGSDCDSDDDWVDEDWNSRAFIGSFLSCFRGFSKDAFGIGEQRVLQRDFKWWV